MKERENSCKLPVNLRLFTCGKVESGEELALLIIEKSVKISRLLINVS